MLLVNLRFFLCLIFWSLTVHIQAQNLQSYVKFNREQTDSLYQRVINDDADINEQFSLFLQSNSMLSEEEKQQFELKTENFLAGVKSNRKFKKGGDKFIKYFHQTVHDEFFRTYQLEAYPEELVSSGVYNCVTGSGLCYYLVKKLNFDAEIREEPQHIYVTVIDDQLRFPMEITDPYGGFKKFDDDFKEKTVRGLKDFKLLDQAKYEGLSDKAIFDSIYLAKQALNLKELIGVQFYNQGIFLSEKGNIRDAMQEFIRAYCLNSSEEIRLALISSLVNNSLVITFDKQKDIDIMLMLSYFVDDEYLLSLMEQTYHTFATKYLVKSDKIDAFLSISDSLFANMDDSLLENLTYQYHTSLADYYSLRGKINESIKFASHALKINPDESNLLQFYVQEHIKLINQHELTDSLYQVVQDLPVSFPLISDMYDYQKLIDFCLIKMLDKSVDEENFKALSMHIKALDLRVDSKQITLSNDIVSDVYKVYSLICFGKNRTNSAIKYIQKAIALAPENREYKNLLTVYRS